MAKKVVKSDRYYWTKASNLAQPFRREGDFWVGAVLGAGFAINDIKWDVNGKCQSVGWYDLEEELAERPPLAKRLPSPHDQSKGGKKKRSRG